MKLWGHLAPEEISGAMNTVFGAAIGAFFGIVLPTADGARQNTPALTVIFAGTFLIVLLFQLLIKLSLEKKPLVYFISVALGVSIFLPTRFFIDKIGVDATFFDAVIITWLIYTVALNLLTHSTHFNEQDSQ